MQLPTVGKTCPKGHVMALPNLTWDGMKFVCRACAEGSRR